MSPAELTAALKARAAVLGFSLAGACAAVEPPGLDQFRRWLEAGHAGTMRYLAERTEAYAHPCHVLEGARSLLMLGMNYRSEEPATVGQRRARVARYAWNIDYHDLIHGRLRELAEFHRSLTPEASVRGVVDTAPLLEREFAQLAGLGWIGKNTLLLNRAQGSWFFLAALLTGEELVYDAPLDKDHCGTCRACLDACPTGALIDARQLDARRCISYLTIELRESMPRELRAGVGEWLFGCDVCQDVCPWNRRSAVGAEPAFAPAADRNPADPIALLALDEQAFRQQYRGTPFWRAKRRGLLRNAAVVLGNQRPLEGLPALSRGLADPEPLVRAACAWALGRYAAPEARAALQARLVQEEDAEVRAEIEASL